MIKVEQITYRRDEKEILKDVNWQVRPGEHWAIIGLNGSGKTTLLNMIMGYIWPTRGSVEVMGNRYGTCDIREVRKAIGWVSSSFAEQLPGHQRVQDVVLSGLNGSMRLYDEKDGTDLDLAYHWMRMFGCEQLAAERYYLLSQGEKQRVLLSRAMMSNPRLLILDEPCSGLDMYARESLLNMINEMNDVPTLIYVTHHIEEILPKFSHVLVMREGQVFRGGDKQSVLTDEVLSDAYRVPIHVTWKNDRPWVQVTA